MTKFAYSDFFTKTNFSFGDDTGHKSSTNRSDFTLDAIRGPDHGSPTSSCPSLPAINGRPAQRGSITFGNDEPRCEGCCTTYREFTAQGLGEGAKRRMSPVHPPAEAQVMKDMIILVKSNIYSGKMYKLVRKISEIWNCILFLKCYRKCQM